MFDDTSCVPAEACSTLRAISCVAAACSSTAAAIAAAISSTSWMVPVIASMAVTRVLGRGLHAADLRGDLLGRLGRLVGQVLDLGRHHREALARITGARRLDGRIQRPGRLVCSAMSVIRLTHPRRSFPAASARLWILALVSPACRTAPPATRDACAPDGRSRRSRTTVPRPPRPPSRHSPTPAPTRRRPPSPGGWCPRRSGSSIRPIREAGRTRRRPRRPRGRPLAWKPSARRSRMARFSSSARRSRSSCSASIWRLRTGVDLEHLHGGGHVADLVVAALGRNVDIQVAAARGGPSRRSSRRPGG